jgi:hypothetical protein
MLKLIVSFSRPPALCLLPPASKPQLKDAVKSQILKIACEKMPLPGEELARFSTNHEQMGKSSE